MKVSDNLPQSVFPAKVLKRMIGFVVIPTTLFVSGCQQETKQVENTTPAPPKNELRLFEYKRPAMGVELVIQVWFNDREKAGKAMMAADARVEALEQVLSNYRPDSEVSMLTESLSDGPVTVSDDLWRVLKQAEQGWQASDQTFDVTISPLADLWRAARKSGELPTTAELDEARLHVGFGKLKMDEAARSVDSGGAAIRFDFGAIGKGDAADEALLILKQYGIESALVELGGDMAIGSAPPNREGWRIAVDSFNAEVVTSHFIEVANCGVATSGDKHQFVEVDGIRYSHIIDPQTGMALQRSSLVSVVAPTGAEADMYASIFSLLQPDAAVKLANSMPKSFVRGEVDSGNNQRDTFASAAFPKLHQLPQLPEKRQ